MNFLSRVFAQAKRLLWFFVRQLLPFVIAIVVEWKYRRIASEQAKTVELTDQMNACFPLDLDELKESHQLELDRREQLRKNAQLNLGAGTLATTIIFAVAKQDTYAVLSHLTSTIAAACALGFMIATALSALRACDTMPVNDMWLQLRVYPFGQNNPELDKKAKFIKATFLNQAGNLIIANWAEASSIGMRNAIIAIGVVLSAALYHGVVEAPTSSSAPATILSASPSARVPTSQPATSAQKTTATASAPPGTTSKPNPAKSARAPVPAAPAPATGKKSAASANPKLPQSPKTPSNP
jgi:hypothetical protein